MLLRSTAIALSLLLAGCSGAAAQTGSSSRAAECALSAADQLWLSRSIAAWNFAIEKLAKAKVGPMTAMIFDNRCLLSSNSAMAGGDGGWSAIAHDGSIPLPDGKSLPAQVASFAAPAGADAFFVMGAPSVWSAGGVRSESMPLDMLMTGVMLHEASHVLQFPTYGAQMTALTARHKLPDSFNDDSIQSQFGADEAFAHSVARETDLLFEAAAARDIGEVRKLARQARALMLARQAKWFGGKDAHLREAEDIWLTMEGSGQWLAYRWLTDPSGGRVPEEIAMSAFAKRGKSWSQKQGIALFLALERLAPAGWQAHVFGGGSRTALDLLDSALATE